jgi:sugar phosphate permease
MNDQDRALHAGAGGAVPAGSALSQRAAVSVVPGVSLPIPAEAPLAASDAAILEHQPGFRARRGINWFLLGLMYAAYYTCRYNIAIAGPGIKHEFGFDNFRYGLINSGRHWSYAVGQVCNGLLADRLGGKQSMAIGAILTVILGLLFGLSSYAGAGTALVLFILIRSLDGYGQAFGAPGMIKVNTAWFPRRERGRFAGVFGLMIQFGQITINHIGPWLLVGFSVPLVFGTLHIGGNWRWLFWFPPCIVAVVLVLMYTFVQNNPEEAGYHVRHDAAEVQADGALDERISLRDVFRTIVSKKMVWITAAAYFCTGVVRTAQFDWCWVYFDQAWGLKPDTPVVKITGALLPIMAFLGSIISGFISDILFRGKRAPVAMGLYAVESVVILGAALLLSWSSTSSPGLAAVFMVLISLTCNSTHSILGTAAAMDLGGRKRAGFASGVIDSFQYAGAGLAGLGLGGLIDYTVRNTSLGWNAWFYFMLPFSLCGMILMGALSYRLRGREVVAG